MQATSRFLHSLRFSPVFTYFAFFATLCYFCVFRQCLLILRFSPLFALFAFFAIFAVCFVPNFWSPGPYLRARAVLTCMIAPLYIGVGEGVIPNHCHHPDEESPTSRKVIKQIQSVNGVIRKSDRKERKLRVVMGFKR